MKRFLVSAGLLALFASSQALAETAYDCRVSGLLTSGFAADERVSERFTLLITDNWLQGQSAEMSGWEDKIYRADGGNRGEFTVTSNHYRLEHRHYRDEVSPPTRSWMMHVDKRSLAVDAISDSGYGTKYHIHGSYEGQCKEI